jgi:hypothetical protein
MFGVENITKLEMLITVKEKFLDDLERMTNLELLYVRDYDPIFKTTSGGYSGYCDTRDSWSLESLKCLSLMGASWTILGSLKQKTSLGLFSSLCCYHFAIGQFRVQDKKGHLKQICGACTVCPKMD